MDYTDDSILARDEGNGELYWILIDDVAPDAIIRPPFKAGSQVKSLETAGGAGADFQQAENHCQDERFLQIKAQSHPAGPIGSACQGGMAD
jgi:hypothetical protein